MTLRRLLDPAISIKAAGGIRTREQAEALVAAGAARLGTSRAAAILAGDEGQAPGRPPSHSFASGGSRNRPAETESRAKPRNAGPVKRAKPNREELGIEIQVGEDGAIDRDRNDTRACGDEESASRDSPSHR